MCEHYKSKPLQRSKNNNLVGLSGQMIKKMQEYNPKNTGVQIKTSNNLFQQTVNATHLKK